MNNILFCSLLLWKFFFSFSNWQKDKLWEIIWMPNNLYTYIKRWDQFYVQVHLFGTPEWNIWLRRCRSTYRRYISVDNYIAFRSTYSIFWLKMCQAHFEKKGGRSVTAGGFSASVFVSAWLWTAGQSRGALTVCRECPPRLIAVSCQAVTTTWVLWTGMFMFRFWPSLLVSTYAVQLIVYVCVISTNMLILYISTWLPNVIGIRSVESIFFCDLVSIVYLCQLWRGLHRWTHDIF